MKHTFNKNQTKWLYFKILCLGSSWSFGNTIINEQPPSFLGQKLLEKLPKVSGSKCPIRRQPSINNYFLGKKSNQHYSLDSLGMKFITGNGRRWS